MRWSQYFIPTLKEVPHGTEAISHQLSLRAGLVHMLTSGVYSYLPLGLKVLKNIEQIIREEMNAAGAHELFLPCLHPLEIWKKTGRDETLADVMIKFKNNKGSEMCLGPTHEEIITDLAQNFIKSYKQLPVTLYQIQTKFRDELRTRYGIVRACEFIMKDAYSFDTSVENMQISYQKMYDAYVKIFERCGLNPIIETADSGAMGGDVSHEFLVPASIGEDKAKDKNGIDQTCIELGHIFQLGTKYSEALGAAVLDENGKQQTMIMGCYGIGVSRFIATIIEVHNDDKGIKWPVEVAPFKVEVLPVQVKDEESMSLANEYYKYLQSAGIDVLMDDRNESPGRKFNDADLIGIPYRVTIGKRTLQEGNVEFLNRLTGESQTLAKGQVIEYISSLLGVSS